jgi:hypothetical protein
VSLRPNPAPSAPRYAPVERTEVAKPGYLRPFRDPTFGSTIERIVGDDGTPIVYPNGSRGTWGSDARQHYTDDQPWNADGSLLWLQNEAGGSPTSLILDGRTYRPKLKPCANYVYYDDRWHPRLPHVRVAWGGATLQWFDVVRCVQMRRWTLPFRVSMDSQGGPSRDGRMWALGDRTRVFAVRMDPLPGVIGPAFDFFHGCGLSDCTATHVSISPSGRFVLVHYTGDHTRILDVNPTTLTLTPHVYAPATPECLGHDPAKGYVFDAGHPDVTLDAQGNDIVVAQNRDWCPQGINGTTLGQVYSIRFTDGAVTSLLAPGTAQSYHVSCRNYLLPGWCYVSFWPSPGKPFDDEIIALKLDGSDDAIQLAHTHTDTTDCYRCEAHPVPSPNGTRLIFASSWTLACDDGCGSRSNPQAYVISFAAPGSARPKPPETPHGKPTTLNVGFRLSL